MPNERETQKSPESALVSEFSCINLIETNKILEKKILKKRIFYMLKQFSLENHEIGIIPGFKHRIVLKSDQIIFKRPYSCFLTLAHSFFRN